MIGMVLAERYELIEIIAEGGMARVFRGHDLLLKRTVAIKVLKDQMTGDAAFVRRFEREAQAVAALSHPNIVNIYDVGKEDSIYFMVMEYVDGKTLKEYIKEKGRLPLQEAISITRQIAEALQEAHQAGVVHRDIKPQNVLFSREGKVKVTDFGIAIAGEGVTVTVGKEIIGSVQYFSPEQARGELAGKQSDLYALGIVLYEMVTGKVPFYGESAVAIAMKHIQEQIVPPRRLINSIPNQLEQVIMRAVQKDSAERYSTAAELLEDLYDIEEKGFRRTAPDRLQNVNPDDEDDQVLKPLSGGNFRLGKQHSRKNSVKWLKPLLLFMLITLLLVGGAYYSINHIFLPEIAVPVVQGMRQSDAAQLLRENGLVPNEEIIYIYDQDIPVGNVVRTDPEEGRVVRKSRVVDLYVSQGPEFIVMPDLTGRTEMETRVLLRDLELTMSVVSEYNEEVPRGFVFRQVPGKLQQISRGDEVVVYVSEGRGPFKLADLRGYTEEGAVDYLRENDLYPRIRYRFTIGASGYVVEQIPKPGEEVQPGQSVDIIVGE